MTEKNEIEKLVNEFISGTGIFLVAIKVSSSNRITVLVDTLQGIRIDECAALHRHLEKNLDLNIGDFELQVSSPGLDMPFGVIEQYQKNEGKEIEVTDTDDVKFNGILKNVTAGGFELETEVRVKGKPKATKDISFNFDQVKSVKAIIVI
jgi:ribosome maturation factor RimP